MAAAEATHVDLMFPNRYLKSGDLRGKEVTLTIANVQMETLQRLDGGEDRSPIVYFEEMKGREHEEDRKVLVLNKTNASAIATLYGKSTDRWQGKRITLHAVMVKAWGTMVEAIRVKVPETGRKRGRK